jgi:hypothetical protein
MKVTDSKAAARLVNKQPGTVSSNTRIVYRESDDVYALELFGNEIAWHYDDGTIQVRTTHASYTTHMRLNALAWEVGAHQEFRAYTQNHEHFVDYKGRTFEDCEDEVFVLRGAQ